MSDRDQASAALRTERVLASRPRDVFTAFERAELLAQWWGPAGFTSTFQHFAFEPGGRWVFMMHGPAGVNYPNESIFREIVPDSKIVIEHVVQPWFRLTVDLVPHGDGTHLTWTQEFESPEVAEKFRALAGTANEQVLDRLQSLLTPASS